MKTMKKYFVLAAVVLMTTTSYAGKELGNGGDVGEMKFKEIANNIEQWIKTDAAANLKLPTDVSYEVYKTKMLLAFLQYSISFTDQTVIVAGTEKTCKNFVDQNQVNQIVCNSADFDRDYKNDVNDIYRLIHHEFAGLAGLETNVGANSDYRISSQIADDLYQEVVSRLPVNNGGDLQLTRKPLCLPLANQALQHKIGVGADKIQFLGGAIVGDGAAVIELDMFTIVAGQKVNGIYKPSPKDGAYKIEIINDQGDGCYGLKESNAQITKLNI